MAGSMPEAMTDEYVKLLAEARQVLERYLFEGVDLRDDVAEVCAKIEQALSAPAADPQPRTPPGIERVA